MGNATSDLSTEDLVEDLKTIGTNYHSKYSETIIDSGLDGRIIASLTEEEVTECFQDLGITSIIHRKKIMLHFKDKYGNDEDAEIATAAATTTDSRSPTVAENASVTVAKRTRVEKETAEATTEGWREIKTPSDRTCNPPEAWIVQQKEPVPTTFLTLKRRISPTSPITYFEIFNRFLPDALMMAMINKIDPKDRILGVRRNSKGEHLGYQCMNVDLRDAWQTMAAQVRIIGRQEKPKVKPLRTNVEEAKHHFESTIDVDISSVRLLGTVRSPCIGNEKLMKLMHVLLVSNFTDEVSHNFCEFVLSLGQYLAGDEKSWKLTGNSGDVRLVISKPDRDSSVLYQLCAMFSSGLPYLLLLRMHNSYTTKKTKTMKTSDIVQSWIDVVLTTGKQYCAANESPNPLTILAMDADSMDDLSREFLLQSGIKFTASVNADRFKGEAKLVQPPGRGDVIGMWKGIVKDTTNELFVYHYDMQRGVGRKFNYSRGFVHTTAEDKCNAMAGHIPAYDYYKQMMEACDNFNRALQDRYFPHKRGGKNMTGVEATHHDFVMACILQNTFNAYHHLTQQDHRLTDFKTFCETLADEMYLHSFKRM